MARPGIACAAMALALLNLLWPTVTVQAAACSGTDCYHQQISMVGSLDLTTDTGAYRVYGPGQAAGIFDVSAYDSSSQTNAAVDVWARLTADSLCGNIFCGFSITLCADRNDDNFCATSGGDEIVTARASNTVCEEDTKQSCNGRDAETATACVHPDVSSAGGDWDNLFVFVGQWAGGSTGFLGDLGYPPQAPGAGAAVGTWDVYLNFGGEC